MPTIGAGYTPVVQGKGDKWAVRSGVERHFTAAGIELSDDHEQALEGIAAAKNVGDVKAVQRHMQALADITLDGDKPLRLFGAVKGKYEQDVRSAIGAGHYDALPEAQKTALFAVAYQSPKTMREIGGDVAKAIDAGDTKAVVARLRQAGKALGDEGRYASAAALWENPTMDGVSLVRSGDTLSALAKRHGTTVLAIKKENGLKNDDLRAGAILRLPTTESGPDDQRATTPEPSRDGADTPGAPRDAETPAPQSRLAPKDREAVETFVAGVAAPGGPVDEAMRKPVETWTAGEMRDVMTKRVGTPARSPEHGRLAAAERRYFDAHYGDKPVKRDETGRMEPPQAVRPLAKVQQPATQPNGASLEDGAKVLGKVLARQAEKQGMAKSVKGLQAGLNLMGKLAAKGKSKAAPRLKEDGVAGPKTQAATRTALAGLGSAKVKEAQALGSFAEAAKDKRARTEPAELKSAVEDGFAPLFGDKSFSDTSKPEEPTVYGTAFQGAVNDTGTQALGETFKPIKEDGVIGPKTTRAFNDVQAADGPGLMDNMSKTFGFFS